MFPSTWTDDRIETLRKLWAKGHSASAIAAELGGFQGCGDGGRNAVLGKIHRLGESSRRVVKPTKTKRDHNAKPLNRKFEPRPPPVTTAAPPTVQPPAAALMTEPIKTSPPWRLVAETCQWPIGHPGQPDYHSCGGRVVKGVYCASHARISHVAAPPRKSSPRPAHRKDYDR